MPVYNVTNESPGARGVGLVLIDAGETREGIELSVDDALLLGDLDGVTVTEAKPVKVEKVEAKVEIKDAK